MQTFLEILKYTLPSLIVFGAVYYVLKQYLDSTLRLKNMDITAKYSKETIQLKLQAYERLLLFCHRIDLPNLILRLKSNSITPEQLKTAMVITVQKEYEHNLAQQLYVSNKLWEILTLAKNNTIDLLSQTPATNQSTDLPSYCSALLELTNKSNPSKVANFAIKEEAKMILNV